MAPRGTNVNGSFVDRSSENAVPSARLSLNSNRAVPGTPCPCPSRWEVYAGLPGGTAPVVDSPFYIGNIALFGNGV